MAETVGWLADKISILELKIYHMREQSERDDASPEFRARCAERVTVLELQRDDLAAELTTLLGDLASGKVVPKLYRQFKCTTTPAIEPQARVRGRNAELCVRLESAAHRGLHGSQYRVARGPAPDPLDG